jgi:hypothetical protein
LLCPSRYASIRTFGELTLVARCIMGSVFIRALLRRCNLPSGLPGGWAKFAWRSHLALDPKRVRLRAVAIRRSLGSPLLWQCSSPPPSSSAPLLLCLSCLLLPLAPMRVVERLVYLPDGLIAKDKFCFVRRERLTLSWPRSRAGRSRNRSKGAASAPAYPPCEAARHGGTHEAPVASPQRNGGAGGRKATLGSGLPEHPAVEPGGRTGVQYERER